MPIIIMLLSYLYLFLELYLYFITLVLVLGWIPGISEHRWFAICQKVADFYIGRFHGLLVLGNIDLTPILGIVVFEVFLYFFRYIILFLGA
jgi:hypothetical protein